jgi:hypothetical protein
MPDLSSTASPPEIVWTFACLLAATVHAWALWDAWADLAAVRYVRPADQRLPLAARGAVRRQIIGLLVQVVFVLIGIAALLTPGSIRPDGSPGVFQVWLPPLGTALAVVCATEAVWDRADRVRLLGMTRARRLTLRERDGDP